MRRLAVAVPAAGLPSPCPHEVAARLGRALGRLENLRSVAVRVAGANSPEAAMGATLAAVLAAEAAAEAFAELAAEMAGAQKALDGYGKGLKAALADAFVASGAPRAECETHIAVPSEGRGPVRITDLARLPLDLVRVVSEPDLAAIGAALKAGPVPGAERGPPKSGIRILAKKHNGAAA